MSVGVDRRCSLCQMRHVAEEYSPPFVTRHRLTHLQRKRAQATSRRSGHIGSVGPALHQSAGASSTPSSRLTIPTQYGHHVIQSFEEAMMRVHLYPTVVVRKCTARIISGFQLAKGRE